MEGILRGRQSSIDAQIEAVRRQDADWARVGDLLKEMVYRSDPRAPQSETWTLDQAWQRPGTP